MKTLKTSTLSFVLTSVCLVGCTTNYKNVYSTLDEAISGFDDIDKTQQEIAELAFASSNIIIDDGARIFVVLALVEPSNINKNQTQLKWASSDYGMLITENGRLVKSLRLPSDNLAGLTDINHADPLSIEGKKPNQKTWNALYDWQPGYRFNFPAKINWRYVSQQTITSNNWTKATNYYQEDVYIRSLDQKFINHFWLDTTTHEVVKSIQTFGPDMPVVNMTILKPYVG